MGEEGFCDVGLRGTIAVQYCDVLIAVLYCDVPAFLLKSKKFWDKTDDWKKAQRLVQGSASSPHSVVEVWPNALHAFCFRKDVFRGV